MKGAIVDAFATAFVGDKFRPDADALQVIIKAAVDSITENFANCKAVRLILCTYPTYMTDYLNQLVDSCFAHLDPLQMIAITPYQKVKHCTVIPCNGCLISFATPLKEVNKANIALMTLLDVAIKVPQKGPAIIDRLLLPHIHRKGTNLLDILYSMILKRVHPS